MSFVLGYLCKLLIILNIRIVKICKPEKEVFNMEIIDRMIRAAKLDSSLYEEVEKDENATRQALIVVIIASIFSGIGTAIANGLNIGMDALILGLIGGAVAALGGWIIWSFITYFLGTNLFKGPKTKSTYWELLRCIGFSDSPAVLAIFLFIPIIGGIIAFIVWIWTLVAMVIAVRQALDFSTTRAILTCIVGFTVMMFIFAVIGLLTYGILSLGIQGFKIY